MGTLYYGDNLDILHRLGQRADELGADPAGSGQKSYRVRGWRTENPLPPTNMQNKKTMKTTNRSRWTGRIRSLACW